MHHEFPPTDAPYPADPDVQFDAPPEQVTTELLELCEQFLRQASPIVHTELSDFLTENGYRPGSLGSLLDTLGFTTLLNRTASANSPGGRAAVSGQQHWPDWATEPVDLADADPAWTVRGEQERDHLDERIDRVRRKRLAVGVGALAAYGAADFGDLVSGQRVRCELLSITIARFAEKSTRSSGLAVIASRCIAFAGAT